MAFGLMRTPAVVFIALGPLVPIAITTAYLLYLKHQVSNSTTSQSGRYRSHTAASKSPSSLDAAPLEPSSIPGAIASDTDEWVITFERLVSRPIPVSNLIGPIADRSAATLSNVNAAENEPSDLLKAYVRAAQEAFGWTPQAFIIRKLIGDPGIKRTFDTDWVRDLSFKHGDVVNGVYCVDYVGDGGVAGCERIELGLAAPPSYRGHSETGLILSAIEPYDPNGAESSWNSATENMVVFVNETWLWRRKNGKPTLLESGPGSWLHSLMAGWLVMKGIKSVTAGHSKEQ